MEVLLGIGLNLVAAGIGYATRLAVERTAKSIRRDRLIRKAWSFLEQPTHVFVPTIRENEVGSAGGFGDLLALSTVINTANVYYPPADQLVMHTRQNSWNAVRDENLVIIGGGKYNAVYRSLVDVLGPPLHFFDTATESFQEIRNSQRTIVYSPEYAADGRLEVDIGLLVLAVNPYNRDRKILIAAGSHTYGSSIALDYLSSQAGVRDIGPYLDAERLLAVVGAAIGDTGIGKPQRVSNILTW